MRQFELALRRLRQLSSRNEGVPDELDLDETVEETASNAGRLSLVWRKSRKNAVKVLLLMDVGGSMHPYIRLCSQLFSAVEPQHATSRTCASTTSTTASTTGSTKTRA